MERNMAIHLLPENMVDLSAITTDEVYLPSLQQQQSTVHVLRLDKMDAIISGNKWFKLQYYLAEAKRSGKKNIVSFGGPYSNHLVAVACAAARAGFSSKGFVRGEAPAVKSPTLRDAESFGMQLHFLSRASYNQKNDPTFIDELLKEYPETCLVPEGGAGDLGKRGAADIWNWIPPGAFTHVLCAVGTGTLLLGLASVPTRTETLIGIPVLKGFGNWINEQVIPRPIAAAVIDGYHFGGYAKKNTALLAFMNEWYRATGIPTDFVYTGKLFFALQDLAQKAYFPEKSRLLVIHSGGLQGNRSLGANSLVF
ncbi:MAG TPA: pyridoxal-phosphate dependent enzyme [Chitinophagaceae bacterium]|nr:pyridoxal-phosphate dependent enzyme [Chitinophagaceae bacterium]